MSTESTSASLLQGAKPETPVSTAPLNDDGRPVRDWGHIKSFVHRKARFSPSQRDAYERLLPVWGLPYQPAHVDFDAAFGRAAPLVLEIGCGMGETTAHLAGSRPDVNYLGVEVFTSGVGALLKRIEEQGLTNLRVMQHDAVEIVRDMIPADRLAGAHIYFPDPWPKARHHKRRLVQPWFIELLASRIAPGGYLHCATDVEDYAQQMLEVLGGEKQLANTAAGFGPRANPLFERPVTKFENRGLKLGHGVWDLVFKRLV
ncbi:MAG TPA: tRNA (guanosine(46)-N7)-methyltransferase TrmB [Burkholderiaceae bacterium]|nr:tRNA (guanosine(46)-N7)-methyltransferase TrmB [Burkholderiaceae bacterium]